MEKENTKSLSAYERILNTAEDLFYQEGIQSVGIDKIIKEAGVAMSTLYKYFPSKDKIISWSWAVSVISWREPGELISSSEFTNTVIVP